MSSYLKKMLYALTSAYSRKDYDNLQSDKPVETNIGKLFSLFTWGLDKVQEQADLIKLWDNLDYAKGKVLDRYGANFGVKRGGASDVLYRLFIKVKMIAQLSGGDEDTVIKAAAEFLGVEYSDICSEDIYPAKKRIYVDLALLSDERKELIEQIAHAIKRTIAAGVGFRLYLRTYRTYILPVSISHGEFIYAADIGTDAGDGRIGKLPLDIQHASRIFNLLRGDIPPSIPRTYDRPLDIAHGSFFERGIEGYYPDMQNSNRGEVNISRGANIERHIETFMPNIQKIIHTDTDFTHGGFLKREINEASYPDTQNNSRHELNISRGASTKHHAESVIPNSQQILDLPANVKHGGFSRNERTSVLPDSKRTLKGNSGNSGAMCITRIKPRRIE